MKAERADSRHLLSPTSQPTLTGQLRDGLQALTQPAATSSNQPTGCRKIILTWMATERGGAEQSTLELSSILRDISWMKTSMIVWDPNRLYGPAELISQSSSTHICSSKEQYRDALITELSSDPRRTVLLSNHRTYALDLHLALPRGVRTAVIFRLAPKHDEAFRALSSAAAADIEPTLGADLDWNLLRKADALVGISEYVRTSILKFAPNHPRVIRIYNAPDTVQAAVVPRPVRRYLVMSRLIPSKAIDLGIRAFSEFHQSHADATLTIAGAGSAADSLFSLVDDLDLHGSVSFAGHVDDPLSFYADHDCLLHLSPTESFGRVLIEAGNAGVLRVAPRTGGAGELVQNNETGFTFDNDVMSCLRALDVAYHLDGNGFARICGNAQREIMEKFHPYYLGKQYLNLASALLPAPRGR